MAWLNLWSVGVWLAIGTPVAVLPTLASAQGYTQQQEQMCSGDALRLCGDAVPDVDRITACMIAKRDQLSAGCKVFFRDTAPALAPAAARRPLSIKPDKVRKAKKRRDDD
jgi:hypothetical protein